MSFNGLTPYHNPNLLATGILIKGFAGKIKGILVSNTAASVRYLKFYDKATAPTVGTDTPVATIALAGSLGPQYIPFRGTEVNEEESGLAFVSGIGIGATLGYLDTNAAAPTNGDIQVNVLYR